jgi:hypothetical protein
MLTDLSVPRCANSNHLGSLDASRLHRIPEQSNLLANCLVVVLWLIAITVAFGGVWLVGNDLSKRQTPLPSVESVGVR